MKTVNRIFLRSFLLQTVWNYELMQGAGYLYSFFPKLQELYREPGELVTGCIRHLNYFNTHPYTISVILGANAVLEENLKGSCEDAAAASNRFKLQMGGPLAALGDKIFWSFWRPLTGLAGVLAVLLGVRPQVLIPFGFIVLYNAPVIYFRYKTLVATYTGKWELIDIIKRVNSSLTVSTLPAAGFLLAACCLAAAFFQWGVFRGAALLFTTAAVAAVRIRFKVSATSLLYLVSLAAVAGSIIIK